MSAGKFYNGLSIYFLVERNISIFCSVWWWYNLLAVYEALYVLMFKYSDECAKWHGEFKFLLCNISQSSGVRINLYYVMLGYCFRNSIVWIPFVEKSFQSIIVLPIRLSVSIFLKYRIGSYPIICRMIALFNAYHYYLCIEFVVIGCYV